MVSLSIVSNKPHFTIERLPNLRKYLGGLRTHNCAIDLGSIISLSRDGLAQTHEPLAGHSRKQYLTVSQRDTLSRSPPMFWQSPGAFQKQMQIVGRRALVNTTRTIM